MDEIIIEITEYLPNNDNCHNIPKVFFYPRPTKCFLFHFEFTFSHQCPIIIGMNPKSIQRTLLNHAP